MSNQALFHGRFQRPSIGHVATVEAILAKWDHLTIGVVYNSVRLTNTDLRLRDYVSQVDIASYGPGRNPFTQSEVKEMWKSYILSMSLMKRVDCLIVKRIEFEPDFNVLFPPEKIDLVFSELNPEDAGADVLRHQLFPEVLGREIFQVKPSLSIHNSEIRRLVLSGHASLRQFIPTGAYEVFMKINGPKRMKAAIRA